MAMSIINVNYLIHKFETDNAIHLFHQLLKKGLPFFGVVMFGARSYRYL